jgi:hypothetical protein
MYCHTRPTTAPLAGFLAVVITGHHKQTHSSKSLQSLTAYVLMHPACLSKVPTWSTIDRSRNGLRSRSTNPSRAALQTGFICSHPGLVTASPLLTNIIWGKCSVGAIVAIAYSFNGLECQRSLHQALQVVSWPMVINCCVSLVRERALASIHRLHANIARTYDHLLDLPFAGPVAPTFKAKDM